MNNINKSLRLIYTLLSINKSCTIIISEKQYVNEQNDFNKIGIGKIISTIIVSNVSFKE